LEYIYFFQNFGEILSVSSKFSSYIIFIHFSLHHNTDAIKTTLKRAKVPYKQFEVSSWHIFDNVLNIYHMFFRHTSKIK
jgi:hypothetical protein